LEIVRAGWVHLEAIHRLGKRDSRTVGFLPRGAFVDYIWRGNAIVAIDRDVVGYVLFATTKRDRVRIAQLVVARATRGQGIARLLIDAVMRDRWHCYAVGLSCRQDFDAATLWLRLGFDAIATRRGRAGVLVRWWRRLGGAGVCASDTPIIWSGESSVQPQTLDSGPSPV
jgi:GNAT superfamily N-acetyltransferase